MSQDYPTLRYFRELRPVSRDFGKPAIGRFGRHSGRCRWTRFALLFTVGLAGAEGVVPLGPATDGRTSWRGPEQSRRSPTCGPSTRGSAVSPGLRRCLPRVFAPGCGWEPGPRVEGRVLVLPGRGGAPGRGSGREQGREGVLALQREVSCRGSEAVEGGLVDNQREREVGAGRVVRGRELGAREAGVLGEGCVPDVVVDLESSIGLLLFQSKFPAFQISIQHTETRQSFGNGPNCGKSAMASLHGENGWRKR